MPLTVLNFSSVVKPRKYERKTFDGLVSADNGHFFFEPLTDAFLETQHENTLLANTTYTKVICLLRLDI